MFKLRVPQSILRDLKIRWMFAEVQQQACYEFGVSYEYVTQLCKDNDKARISGRARYPSLQVRSDTEEALKHVLKDACEKVLLD